jgi:hypothetical protein
MEDESWWRVEDLMLMATNFSSERARGELEKTVV